MSCSTPPTRTPHLPSHVSFPPSFFLLVRQSLVSFLLLENRTPPRVVGRRRPILYLRPCTAMANLASATGGAGSKLRQPTILDCVLVDHRNALALLDQFDKAAERDDTRGMDSLVEAIYLEILMHSHAEETVLYPFIEKRMGQEGKEFSEHSLKEHKKLERELVQALHERKVGNKALVDVLRQMRKDFEHHLHDEEDDFLPKLQDQASVEELTELAPQFIQAKKAARLQPMQRQ